MGGYIGSKLEFGHNKTIENPLYQQKTKIERNIYEVFQPGRRSFYVVARLGKKSFMRYLGRDGTVFMYILGKHTLGIYIDIYQAQLLHLLRFSLWCQKTALKTILKTVLFRPRYPTKTVLFRPRCLINISLHCPFKCTFPK